MLTFVGLLLACRHDEEYGVREESQVPLRGDLQGFVFLFMLIGILVNRGMSHPPNRNLESPNASLSSMSD
jgi:hypothetical protein